jgi:hypothetical protein
MTADNREALPELSAEQIDRFEAALSDLGPATRQAAAWICRLAKAALASREDDARDAKLPEGYVIAPAWKGYALLGTGNYVIQHSAEFDPELGAELFITLATDEDREGGRQIGESRATRNPNQPVYPEDMVLRIGFLSERALFALEDQLRTIRELHFPDAALKEQS